MDLDQKIQSFKKMAESDPTNELGHFSLGQAYLEARDYTQAADSLQRVVKLNAGFSRAYQLLGYAQKMLGRNEDAIASLQQGYAVASKRGELMPKVAMGKMLQEMGQALPQVEVQPAPAQTVAFTGEGVQCSRCQQQGPKLAKAPQPGALGQRILDHVCQNCWKEWLSMGVKVINELQLDFTRPGAAATFDAHMKEFLNLPEAAPPRAGLNLFDLKGPGT